MSQPSAHPSPMGMFDVSRREVSGRTRGALWMSCRHMCMEYMRLHAAAAAKRQDYATECQQKGRCFASISYVTYCQFRPQDLRCC